MTQQPENFDIEPTILPDDIVERMRSGEITFLIGIDSNNRLKLFYVEGNAPTDPGTDADAEPSIKVQLAMSSCGCVNRRVKRYVTMGGRRYCLFTNVPC